MTLQCEPRRAGGAAGALGMSTYHDRPQRFTTSRRPLQAPRYQPRFRRQVEQICRLGPYAVACLLEQVSAGGDLEETVARYAALDAALIATYGGDRFPAPMLALDGGAP